MKKAFYMMAAAAIALSSCSSEETTDVAKSSTITFRTTVGLNSRGAELTSFRRCGLVLSIRAMVRVISTIRSLRKRLVLVRALSFLNLHSTGRKEEHISLLPFHQKRLLGRLLLLLQRTR